MNGPNNPIGWCDYTWNPVKGLCPEACAYCYARRFYTRFHYNPEIRLDEKELMMPYKLKKQGTKIFCGSTIDLFNQDVHGAWLEQIIEVIRKNQQHIFQFLYRFNPYRSLFPDNCWLGLTVTSDHDVEKAIKFVNTYPAHIKFISFEPLLGYPKMPEEVFEKIEWLIISAETGNRKRQVELRSSWIEYLLNQADKYNLRIFMKANLGQFWHGVLVQEFPERKKQISK
jgi:protein gp37